jgi:hypothetical protein
MSLRLANGELPSSIKAGSTTIKRVYRGGTNVWGDWTPSELTDLYIWMDAADTSSSSISESSGRVSTWHDKSGNSRDFSSGGGTNWNIGISDSQPYTGSRTLNGHNVIDFQGAEHLRSDQTIGTQTLCVFQAGVMDSFEFNDASALSFGNSANDRADLHSFSTAKFFARLTKDLATNDVFLDTNTAIHPGDSYFHSLHIDATGNSIEYFKDGTRYGSIQHQDTSRLNTNNRLILYNYRQIQLTDSNYDIGFRNRGAVDGCLGEVIVTDATVSTADRQKIEGYLAHKWGMTDNLPSDHPYKTLWPTT